MRIAQVTFGLDDAAAGVGEAVSSLSLAQLGLGHEVKVFGIASRDQLGNLERWGEMPLSINEVRAPFESIGYAPSLLRSLCEYDPQIVHLHGLWLYPALAVLNWSSLTRRPFIYSVHGMLNPQALEFSYWKKRVARLLFQDRVLRSASIIHATSDREAKDIEAFGLANPVSIVPWGIWPANVPVFSSHETRKKILFLGRIHPIKGLECLVRAWAEVENDFLDWDIDIVGSDHDGYSTYLRQLAKELDVKRLSISPPMYGSKRDSEMAAADLFVLPSLTENFAMTVAESLMMETPVIVTKGVPWARLQQQGCGWQIDHGIEHLEQALRFAMSLGKSELKKMGRSGRNWMLREYQWGSVAKIMIETYRSVSHAH
jgi:glycosyltransferase involved in cell wall biosynthesis